VELKLLPPRYLYRYLQH